MNITPKIPAAVVLAFVLVLNLHSQKAGRDEVLSLSGDFLKNYFTAYPRSIDNITVYGTEQEPLIYIVNLDPEGWILLSGNKGATPVIGFNYSGTFVFPAENSASPEWNWLSRSTSSLAELYDSPAEYENDIWSEGFTEDLSKSVSVQPLITTYWGQGDGWNQFCPEDDEGPGGRALVGCVGVAMAQALSVFELPDYGAGENSYEHTMYGIISTDYSKSVYSWDQMSDNKANEYSAKLLYDCATSVNMNFGPDASSATTSKAADALKTYFSMSETITYINRDAYGAFEWEGMMRTELINGRPVIYRGRSDDGTSGHAFNVDGVVSDRYFHINWGWEGSKNGYFYLHELNPGTRSYNNSQAAIVNIRPNSTSIETAGHDGTMTIYPNPAISTIKFSGISPGQISGVRIYSASGSLLKYFKHISVSEGISISDLPVGIYILEARLDDGSSIRRKVIKQ